MKRNPLQKPQGSGPPCPRWVIYDQDDGRRYGILAGWLTEPQAHRISTELATLLKWPVALIREHHTRSNPSLAAHTGKPARWHITSESGQPFADLYFGIQADAGKVARLLANIKRERVRIYDNATQPKHLSAHPDAGAWSPNPNPKRRNPNTMTLTKHESAEFSRAAQAMYARGQNDLGHLLSMTAAVLTVPQSQYDRAAEAYRAWLVFDEPKANPSRTLRAKYARQARRLAPRGFEGAGSRRAVRALAAGRSSKAAHHMISSMDRGRFRRNPRGGRRFDVGESVIYRGPAWWYEREGSRNTLIGANEQRYNEPANVMRAGVAGRYLMRSANDGRLAWADSSQLELPLANPRSRKANPKGRKRNPRGGKIAVGDLVQYRAAFLRSTGMYTGDVPRAKGIVTALTPFGGAGNALATIEWDLPGIPERVLTPNLKRVGDYEPNPSYRLSGTIEAIPDAPPVARRGPGRPRKVRVAPVELAAELDPVPFEVPAEAPGRELQAGDRVTVPYSGRASYFGRAAKHTRESGIFEGYTYENDQRLAFVRVNRGGSVETHAFPVNQVRLHGKSFAEQAAAHRAGRPAKLARLTWKAKGSLAKAEAMLAKAIAEHADIEAVAMELYPQHEATPGRPRGRTAPASREYLNARAKLRRLTERVELLGSVVRSLGGGQEYGQATGTDPWAANRRRYSNPIRHKYGASGTPHTVRGVKRKRNPSGSEYARAVKTFKMWHEFDPHRVTRIKGPNRMIPRTLVKLGDIRSIDYISDKYEGGPVTYTHKTDRPRPVLATDPDGRNLHIVGGRVKITADGLIH